MSYAILGAGKQGGGSYSAFGAPVTPVDPETPTGDPGVNNLFNSKLEGTGVPDDWTEAYPTEGTVNLVTADAAEHQAVQCISSGSDRAAIDQTISIVTGQRYVCSVYCTAVSDATDATRVVLNITPFASISLVSARPTLGDMVADTRFNFIFDAVETRDVTFRVGLAAQQVSGGGNVTLERPMVDQADGLRGYVATDPYESPVDPEVDLDFVSYQGMYEGQIDFCCTHINTSRLNDAGYRGWRWTARRTGNLSAVQYNLSSNKSGETSKSEYNGSRSHGYPASWDVGMRVFNADANWQISGAYLRQFEFTYTNPDGVGGSDPNENNTRVIFEHDLSNLAVTAGQRLLFLVYNRESNPGDNHPSVNMASNYGRPTIGQSPPRAVSLYCGDDPVVVSSSTQGGTLSPMSQRLYGLGLRYSDGAEWGSLAFDCTPASYNDANATSTGHVGFVYGSRRIRQRWSSPRERTASQFALAVYRFPNRTPAAALRVVISGPDITTQTMDIPAAQIQQFDFTTSGATLPFTHQTFDLNSETTFSAGTTYTVELSSSGSTQANRYQTHFIRQFKAGLSRAENTSPTPSGPITVIEPNKWSGLAETSSNAGSTWTGAGYGGNDTDMLFALILNENVGPEE